MMRISYHRLFAGTAAAIILCAQPLFAVAGQPIVTDSRIKTLVYNPNEVFAITTHYGYQSNIEFGPKETIDTISVGDRIGWQISPAGRRLFIRAQEENAHTNMTVVTNQRAYQFDLRSSTANAVFGSEELTYVVRFFYPEEGESSVAYMPMPVVPPAPSAAIAPEPPAPAVTDEPAPAPTSALAPLPTGAIPSVNMVDAAPKQPTPAFNYRYTYSGSNEVAPTKIFDDGKSTYFKFTGDRLPRVAVITSKGEMLEIPAHRTADGLVAVSAVAPRFSITDNGQQVVVYNEAGGVL